ncbi:AAA family ATPase [Deefgea piscis]|uniref:AAA family ATPase n=1 Tax=Deefgea piscis TaxID=2739061 RepID=UPI001C7E7254|nr:ATP-binding protein [Deefgea piscis]QZA79842.1 ATP-binding protein [Deefgea piscis]
MRIAIVGPESCGKSTLGMALAAHFQCAYVAEYAREYFATHPHQNYGITDVIHIAQRQFQQENEMASQYAHLICDTSPLVCRIWAEVKFGHCPLEIAQLELATSYDGILLCAPDLPWQADPLRENPSDRNAIFERYAQRLQMGCTPFRVVTGLGAQRLACAQQQLSIMGIDL